MRFALLPLLAALTGPFATPAAAEAPLVTAAKDAVAAQAVYAAQGGACGWMRPAYAAIHAHRARQALALVRTELGEDAALGLTAAPATPEPCSAPANTTAQNAAAIAWWEDVTRVHLAFAFNAQQGWTQGLLPLPQTAIAATGAERDSLHANLAKAQGEALVAQAVENLRNETASILALLCPERPAVNGNPRACPALPNATEGQRAAARIRAQALTELATALVTAAEREARHEVGPAYRIADGASDRTTHCKPGEIVAYPLAAATTLRTDSGVMDIQLHRHGSAEIVGRAMVNAMAGGRLNVVASTAMKVGPFDLIKPEFMRCIAD